MFMVDSSLVCVWYLWRFLSCLDLTRKA